MNILLVSDYHLSENKRINDFKKSLIQIEEFSQHNNIDVYINAGDVFHGMHYPTPLELQIFTSHIKNVKARRKIIIPGNHDIISPTLSYLDWAQITDLEIKSYLLEEFNGKKVYCFDLKDLKRKLKA